MRLSSRTESQRTSIAAALIALAGLSTAALGQGGLPYTIEPPEGSVEFGRSVASGGDVDGDRLPDIFVADPAFAVGNDIVGRWFIFSGAGGSMIFSEVGERPYLPTWDPIIIPAFIGDLDGDDRAEFIVGLPDAEGHRGVVMVYSLSRREPIYTFIGNATDDLLGLEVRGVGDVNRDDVPDFAFVGRYNVPAFVSVRSGATGEEIYRIDITTDTRARRIRSAGDLDGDLVPDLVVGSSGGGQGGAFSAAFHAVSGANGERLWSAELGSWAGFSLAAGVDLSGDDVPDVVTAGQFPDRALVLSGATGAQILTLEAPVQGELWGLNLNFANVNGDGAADLVAARFAGGRFGIDALETRRGRVLHWAQGTASNGVIRLLTGNETAVADVNGDGSDDFIIGSVGAGVSVFGGSPLLLNFAEMRDNYDLTRGQPYDFTVGGGRPERTMHLLGSVTGNGCTFIQRLGICIDLDQRIYRLGAATTDPQRVARFTVQVPLNMPLGPVWLQAIDPADPARGAIKSNVMRLEVVD